MRPRWRVRTLLIATAVVAAALGFGGWGKDVRRRARDFGRRAALHAAEGQAAREAERQALAELHAGEQTVAHLRRLREREEFSCSDDFFEQWASSLAEMRQRATDYAERSAYHARWRRLYEDASWKPWASVPPEPPGEPTGGCW
jgi:hypothetical protein